MDVRSRTDLIGGLTGASGANRADPFAETETPALLAAIVESSDDAIIGCDLQGIIRTWTKGAERIFGYQAHEVIGQPASILAPAERPNEVSYILARIRRGEHIDPYEAVRCRKDGQRIVVSLTVSPILNRSGEIIGSSKIARRISQTQKLEETLRTFDTQLMLLAEASSAVLASPHTADVLCTIIELAQRLGSADGNAVWRRRDTDGVWALVSSAGLSQEYVQTRVTEPSGSQLLPRGPLVFEDVIGEPFLAIRRDVLKKEGICSMLVIPLYVHGQATGTVAFYWKTPHRFTDSEVRIASALGNIAAAALGTAELYERETELRNQAQASQQRAAFLAEASAVLASSLDYETTLRTVARLAIERFADWCAVDVARDGNLQRVTLEHVEPSKIQLAREYRERYPPREDDVSHVAFRTGEAVLVKDIPDELLVERIRDPEQLRMVRAMGIKSLMVTPMVNRGRTLGLLTFVSSKRDQRYTDIDLALAQELAKRAALAIDNALLYRDVRSNEARYRSLVSATTSVVWTTSPAGEFIEPQPSWQAYTGQTWEQQRGFGWATALHPDDRDRIEAAWLRSRDESRTYEAEGRLWHAPSNSYRYCIARATPVRNPDTSICEWIGTVTDIHERKQAEEERKALLSREQRARSTAQLLNRVGQILSAELDPQSLAKSVIDIATKLVDAELGALIHNVVDEKGKPSSLHAFSGAPGEAFANFPMPRHAAEVGPTFEAKGILRSEDIRPGSQLAQMLFPPGVAQGHSPVRSYLAVSIISRSGEVLGGLFFGHSQPAVFHEQSEEFAVGIASQAAIALDNARLFMQSQQAQNALRKSNEELRRANEDLNRFAYSASHDLQEPLRMVSAFSGLLQKRYQGKLDSQANEYINYAVQGARQMEALVRDILAYTQVTNIEGKESGPLDTNAALRKVLSNLQQSIEASGAIIEYGQLPVLNVAEIHIVQVFQNLISNAIKYAGHTPPRIQIHATPHKNSWLFSIRDSGIGIDPQYQEQIFGLFKRLHTSAEYDGTGIGLAICQKIVERYGGRIWVESALGQGATFYFTLPDKDSPKAA